MTHGDELIIHRIDSPDSWRGEVVSTTAETVSARLSNGALLEFRRDDGEDASGGMWRLAPKHLARNMR